jgi:hypothetical protein
MIQSVVITDVTRMEAPRVCVAGYAYDGGGPGRCIRPEHRYGDLTEPWLGRRRPVVQPFAVVDLDLVEARPDRPHTEDWLIEDGYLEVARVLQPTERRLLLQNLDDSAVENIFGTEIVEQMGWWVAKGTGDRSLGTIEPDRIWEVFYSYDDRKNKWDYRIAFRDKAGKRYKLAVTDLAFRYYLDDRRVREHVAPTIAAQQLTQFFRTCTALHLRIGLTRGPRFSPDRCYLQITGVYSFPDYLQGKCFADLAPRTEVDISGVPF